MKSITVTFKTCRRGCGGVGGGRGGEGGVVNETLRLISWFVCDSVEATERRVTQSQYGTFHPPRERLYNKATRAICRALVLQMFPVLLHAVAAHPPVA